MALELSAVMVAGMAGCGNTGNTGNTDTMSSTANDTKLDSLKYGDMWNSSDLDEKYYTFPTRTTCWALFYNSDLLKQEEIENPAQMTWDEYIDYSEKVEKGY